MRLPILAVLALSCSATAFGQPDDTAVEALPKVVLVGDSIRLSYAPIVTKQLAGKSAVVSPKANGGDSIEKVMAELNVPVNDLHTALSKPAPPLATEALIGKDGVHLTSAARELLGKKVAVFIAEFGGEQLPR